MRKPFTIKEFSSGNSIEIDLFEINQLYASDEIEDIETGNLIQIPDEVCHIIMNDGKEYDSKMTLSEALYVSKQMWKSKTKDTIRNLFKDY